jgi:hypothetical protein
MSGRTTSKNRAIPSLLGDLHAAAILHAFKSGVDLDHLSVSWNQQHIHILSGRNMKVEKAN